MIVATTVLGFASHGVLRPLWNMQFSPLFMLSKVFQSQQGFCYCQPCMTITELSSLSKHAHTEGYSAFGLNNCSL